MDRVYAMLDNLEDLVNEGKRFPLTNQFVINREAVIAAIQEIRDHLPDAVVQANQILEQESQIREDANYQYETIVADAEDRARALNLDSQQMADDLMNDAQNQADQLYASAQREASDMVSSAQRKAQELISQTSIMVEADREANRILTEARAEAQRDRLATLDHCDALLKRAEDMAIDVANKLRDERMSFDHDR
ncbi:hypothetical protein LJC74_02770 [Eubacteriales bacterium OttesenSCG-928-A19]|nr:hypothetical protein [Eubacteriales bacterium OttesenSCG-928-A19]